MSTIFSQMCMDERSDVTLRVGVKHGDMRVIGVKNGERIYQRVRSTTKRPVEEDIGFVLEALVKCGAIRLVGDELEKTRLITKEDWAFVDGIIDQAVMEAN
jgi:hypothetical protein